ncbi:putative Glucose-6-phosphate isomerase [Candidatus Zixiibacteriota bacterium]|nr:putative Glucose-6-phosphate isomerase [candidate division Zixibacteria bacterium]
MKKISFDFNNMMSHTVGGEHGVTEAELRLMAEPARKAREHLTKLMKDARNRTALELEWTRLPYQKKSELARIWKLGREISKKYKNVIFLGIGGSYLGLKAAQDALCPPYYNDFEKLRRGKPKIFFEGNNLDPDTIGNLLANLKPKETFVVVISKSGETTETKVALAVVSNWLKKGVGSKYGRQILAITDPKSGSLRKRVEKEQVKDKLSFRSLPLERGVGGRYSEFNMGLLHLAIIGIRPDQVLSGARQMAVRCMKPKLSANPALMYAVLHTVLYLKKDKGIAIMMPFSETLKATGDWYAQLLAESLGKKFSRKVISHPDRTEKWENDQQQIVHTGRTPVATRGTNDLHSIHQNNVEGENNKVVTFLRIDKFAGRVRVPSGNGFVSGKEYGELIKLAQEATAWSLARENRASCVVSLPELTPYNWGALLFFFEMATAYEGELLNVNAFNQPGVESYKNYMYYKLRKPGLAADIEKEIKTHSFPKKKKYIL